MTGARADRPPNPNAPSDIPVPTPPAVSARLVRLVRRVRHAGDDGRLGAGSGPRAWSGLDAGPRGRLRRPPLVRQSLGGQGDARVAGPAGRLRRPRAGRHGQAVGRAHEGRPGRARHQRSHHRVGHLGIRRRAALRTRSGRPHQGPGPRSPVARDAGRRRRRGRHAGDHRHRRPLQDLARRNRPAVAQARADRGQDEAVSLLAGAGDPHPLVDSHPGQPGDPAELRRPDRRPRRVARRHERGAGDAGGRARRWRPGFSVPPDASHSALPDRDRDWRHRAP